MPPTEDGAHNPGICPEQESNQRPLGSWVDTQPLTHSSQAPLALLEVTFTEQQATAP